MSPPVYPPMPMPSYLPQSTNMGPALWVGNSNPISLCLITRCLCSCNVCRHTSRLIGPVLHCARTGHPETQMTHLLFSPTASVIDRSRTQSSSLSPTHHALRYICVANPVLVHHTRTLSTSVTGRCTNMAARCTLKTLPYRAPTHQSLGAARQANYDPASIALRHARRLGMYIWFLIAFFCRTFSVPTSTGHHTC